MNSGGGSPPQFNAQQAAQQQTQSNVNTALTQAQLNNVNQVTPYGNLTYSQTGGSYNDQGDWIPQYTATQTLSPEQQQIYNETTGLQNQALGQIAPGVLNQVQSSVSNPLNFNNAPAMPTSQTAAENSAFNQLMSRQNQNFQLQTQQMDTQLRNQGIMPGTQAYDNAMRPIQQAQTDAVNQAQLNATQLAGQNINQAQQLRNQTINEDTALYNSPMQTYSTLLGLGGGVQSPNFVNTPQTSVQPTDIMGADMAQYQGQMNAYNQQLQQQNAMMGGLFGLAGSGLGGWALGGFKGL